MNTGARLVKGLRSKQRVTERHAKHPPQRIAQHEHLDVIQAGTEVTTECATVTRDQDIGTTLDRRRQDRYVGWVCERSRRRSFQGGRARLRDRSDIRQRGAQRLHCRTPPARKRLHARARADRAPGWCANIRPRTGRSRRGIVSTPESTVGATQRLTHCGASVLIDVGFPLELRDALRRVHLDRQHGRRP